MAFGRAPTTTIADAMKNVMIQRRTDTNQMPIKAQEMVYATVAVKVLTSRWRARTDSQT